MLNFTDLINSILSHYEFEKKPPVLIDIGASGDIFEKWTRIAKKSICIAFDADDRDFVVNSVEESTGYHKLYKFNRIVLPTAAKECTFYLTHSPYCSSTLQPDTKSISDWMFAPLFEVEKKVTLPSVTVAECLDSIDIDYIDWYKVDSQGIDMDIFLSIPEQIRTNILAADFETGIMDAYINENKTADLLVMLDREKYWASSFDVKGTQRLDQKYSQYSKLLHESPCWVGITSLKQVNDQHNVRSALLLIVFSLIENQWGYALEVCKKVNSGDPVFQKIHGSILDYIDQKEQARNRRGKTFRRFKNLVKKIIGRP